jgi:lipoprotein NlpI
MSLGKLDESLKWFAVTTELDPYHFGATMEYFKSIIGRGDVYDAVAIVRDKVESAEAESWSPNEKADVYFYLGIAYFLRGNTASTLDWWGKVSELSETPFNLVVT